MGALDRGRTARSLAYLLSKYERIKLYFIAPEELKMKQDILDHLDERGINYEIATSPKGILNKVDVVYQTRIDRSWLSDPNYDLSDYNIDTNVLSRMKYNAIIMHPLPRSVELSPEVDKDPRAAYFRQAKNGLFVRMALLTMIFD
jgi:aspartate carbamoyltransferase catalytic subunit